MVIFAFLKSIAFVVIYLFIIILFYKKQSFLLEVIHFQELWRKLERSHKSYSPQFYFSFSYNQIHLQKKQNITF